jgi:CRISPR/Cas system-associated endoribonuclease Cas2
MIGSFVSLQYRKSVFGVSIEPKQNKPKKGNWYRLTNTSSDKINIVSWRNDSQHEEFMII